MITLSVMPFLLTGVPLAGIAAALLPFSWQWRLRIPVVSSAVTLIAALAAASAVEQGGTVVCAAGNLFLDPLNALHACLAAAVFCFSSVFGVGYFTREIQDGKFLHRRIKNFVLLWQGFLAVMMLVFTANNMGILWVALEGTTLVSAFLILTDGQRASIEAMWKYLLVCSVGILFAFVGTLLLSVATRSTPAAEVATLQWTWLAVHAGALDPRVMLAAFIFALVGFGTKAGLAPMHTWLPDAHSQSPTPVSAAFSGIMLSCAMYCIMRYLPLVEHALGGTGEARQLLLIFGLVSMAVSAAFIIAQSDIKRFLAYSSVEHIGIIAVGLGLGGIGIFAALFHTINHSLAKTVAFCSAGRVAQDLGTRDMRQMHGAISASPVWGGAFFISVLALAGVAPFAVFMSEFQILQGAAGTGQYVALVVFLFALAVVFVSVLTHAMNVSLGVHPELGTPREVSSADVSSAEATIIVAFLATLLFLGLWMPRQMVSLLSQAAAIVGGGP